MDTLLSSSFASVSMATQPCIIGTAVHNYWRKKTCLRTWEWSFSSTFSAGLPSNTYLFLHGSGINVFWHLKSDHVARLLEAPVHNFSISWRFMGRWHDEEIL
jgi:hypothetical protein